MYYRDTLVDSSKKTGLDVSDDKTKYAVMSQDQNAGRSHSKKTEKKEEF
jgi:hypothetical protein